MQANWVGYIDNMMRYHLNVEPDNLTDEKWAETVNQLSDIRQRESKQQGG